MVCCAAFYCKSEQGNKKLEKGVTFHRFPKDDRRTIWIKNIRRVGWQPSAGSKLCSKHFQEECFEPKAEFSVRRRLKTDAVPTIFNNYPLHLQPKIVKLRKPPKLRNSIIEMKKENLKPAVPSRTSFNVNALDHSYAFPSQEVLAKRLQKLFEGHEALSKKLRATKKTLSKKNKKIMKMKDVISKLKVSRSVK